MAEWDLTVRMSQHLDPHLVFPLLEFLATKGIYNEKDLLQEKLRLVDSTKMVDLSIDIYTQLTEKEAPAEYIQKRAAIMAEMKSLEDQAEAILPDIMKEDVHRILATHRDHKTLFEQLSEHGVTVEKVDVLAKYAKFQFECGNYELTSRYLNSHRLFMTPQDKNYLSDLWGELSSCILLQQWQESLEALNRLKEHIDSAIFTNSLQLLQQRTWLIHWGLFVYFNHENGKEMLIEMLLSKAHNTRQQPYLNAVQTICPHILRYLTVAVITSRKRRDYMKELVKVIQQESYTYRDPITEFVECLCVNYDFDGAQRKLRECENVFSKDFFLVSLQPLFIDHARLFVFEIFCQIHQCVSISMLAEKLNMDIDDAEKWIVNLIREARLDAKIDSKLGHVVMGTTATSPYQQLIEKTKSMSLRSQVLSVNIDKKMQLQASDRYGETPAF